MCICAAHSALLRDVIRKASISSWLGNWEVRREPVLQENSLSGDELASRSQDLYRHIAIVCRGYTHESGVAGMPGARNSNAMISAAFVRRRCVLVAFNYSVLASNPMLRSFDHGCLSHWTCRGTEAICGWELWRKIISRILEVHSNGLLRRCNGKALRT